MSIDLTLYRHRLAEEAARLGEALAQAGDSASTVTLDQSSVGRLSRMDALQQQAMAKGFRDRLLTRKRTVEAAFDRIDAGTFGQCCLCHSPLEPKRLEADPATVFCMDCMTERGSTQ